MFSKTQYQTLQTSAIQNYLSKLRFNRKFPAAVIFGPAKFGGQDEKEIFSIMAKKQIKLLMGHVRNGDETGKLILCELDYIQVSGLSHSILHSKTPINFMKQTPKCWISDFKAIMTETEGEVKIHNQWVPSIQRKYDSMLMERFQLLDLRQEHSKYTKQLHNVPTNILSSRYYFVRWKTSLQSTIK